MICTSRYAASRLSTIRCMGFVQNRKHDVTHKITPVFVTLTSRSMVKVKVKKCFFSSRVSDLYSFIDRFRSKPHTLSGFTCFRYIDLGNPEGRGQNWSKSMSLKLVFETVCP